MRAFILIVKNSLTESLRKRFLVGLLVAGLFVLALSLMFAQLSLDDKGRLTTDFGLATTQILLVAMAVFFASHFIAQDLDKKIWMILTRPVSPSLFFLARYVGLCCLLFLALVALSVFLIVFFVVLKIPIQAVLFYCLLGFLLESYLLLAFVLFFSSYASSFLVLFYCLSLFIIGHFLQTLFFFIEKTSGGAYNLLSQAIKLLPDLEKINFKSLVVYQDPVSFLDFASASLYIFLWIGLVLSLSLFIMEKKEFG